MAAETHEDRYEAATDALVAFANAREPLSYDAARPALLQAMDAIRWYRWARGLFRVPDDVSDGELRQWIGERLANGDFSIVDVGEVA